MERIKVESSSIKSIGYNVRLQILEIEFTRGAIYQYKNVSYEIYHNLTNAESIGKYFAQYIKNNYEFEQIEGV